MVRDDLTENYEDLADQEKQKKFQVNNRQIPLYNNVLSMLGTMLQPATEGYPQINVDMTFTDLDTVDKLRVENYSMNINIMSIWGLKQSEFLERGRLATLLNANRSKGARSMNLFNHVVTETKQKFSDETDTSRGFSLPFFGKKKNYRREE